MRETARRVKTTATLHNKCDWMWLNVDWEFLSFPLNPAESKWQSSPCQIHWMKMKWKWNMFHFLFVHCGRRKKGKRQSLLSIPREINVCGRKSAQTKTSYLHVLLLYPKYLLTPFHFSCFSCVIKRESGNTLRGKYKKMDPVDPLSSIPFFKDFDPSVDKLTKPKWNYRPISWPRPLPRRPLVSRLDAKPNSDIRHRPLWCEWVGRCPLTESIRKTTSSTWHAHSNDPIYLNPSVVRTSGQTFRPFVPCHICCYRTLHKKK